MATRNILLRGGDARDIAAIETLMAQAFDPRFGEAWNRGQTLGVMAMPGVRLMLAYVDDIPVGFAMTRTVIDEAELLLLAVVPATRRAGIATALLRSVEADGRDAGVRQLHLEVRAGNEAVKLYARAGFAKVGERRNYYRGADMQAHDAHTYLKMLA
ncbi:GNAT family N-acetyltransferase [uncultured Sphingomonas sp.]|uniref:GNAT family N-acetyltransferase n=1 Tax=uncultured Sphingomonas sp. TaxID=158754 RepID=UPI0035CA3879